MAVLVDAQTRVICQGITGAQGSFYAEQAIAAALETARHLVGPVVQPLNGGFDALSQIFGKDLGLAIQVAGHTGLAGSRFAGHVGDGRRARGRGWEISHVALQSRPSARGAGAGVRGS